MNFDAEIQTPDHGAEWLENYGDDGGLQICCEAGGETGCFIVSAGWGHFTTCPVCGGEIDLRTEEA